MRDWKRGTVLGAGAFLVYALLTILMTWPVCGRLSTHLIGNGDDMWVHYWNGWWVRRIIQQGGDLYYTHLLFHPTGVSLLFHNFAWFNIGLWLLFEPALGGIAAYNLAFLIHIPLCGLSMYLLVRHLTNSTSAAFLGGIIYAFLPYRMLHANHPNVISTEGFPLLMLVLIRLVEGKHRLRDGLLGGLLIAFIGYTRWQFLVLAGIMTGGYLLYSLIWERERWDGRTVLAVVVMVTLAAAVMGPALYPLVREELTAGLPEEVDTANFENGKQDILTYVIPQHQHPLRPLYDRVFPAFAEADLRERYSAFLGHVVTVLVIVGTVKYWKKERAGFWLALTAGSVVLALGPHLWVNQVQTGIPMPYRLVGWLKPIRLLGPPRRFNVLLGLPLTVLATYGMVSFRDQLAGSGWGRRLAQPVVFACALGSLLLLDYVSIPTNTICARVPEFYSTLAAEAEEFALVGLPGSRKHAETYMFYQTVHARPLASGHVSNLPPQALAFMSSVPLTADLYEEGDLDVSRPDVSHQLSRLADAGFRYLVAHKHLAPPDVVNGWRAYLVASPRYEDAEVAVFSTSPIVGQDVGIQHRLTESLGVIEAKLSSDKVQPESSLELQAVWGTTAPPGRDCVVEISLVNEDGETGQVERFEVCPTWSVEEWPSNAIVHGSYSFRVDPWLAAGEHTVVVALANRDDGRICGREAQVGQFDMGIPARVFQAPAMEETVGATFGTALRLLGYTLEQGPERLKLTLHWEALRRMERSYKFFLHMYDVETGELVAQKDVIPRDWTYPTTWWEAHEVVSDELGLALTNIPPGRYQAGIGVYDSKTLDRLTVNADGSTAPAEALLLQEIVIP